MLLEIFITMFITLAAATGTPAAIVILVVAAIASFALCGFLANLATEALLGPSQFRGGEKTQPGFSTMDEFELARWIRRNPKDIRAVMEQAERLRKTGDLKGYVEQMRAVIKRRGALDLDEVCSIHHQIADLYLGPLDSRDEAVKILQAFVDANPDTAQAERTRERIGRVAGMVKV